MNDDSSILNLSRGSCRREMHVEKRGANGDGVAQ